MASDAPAAANPSSHPIHLLTPRLFADHRLCVRGQPHDRGGLRRWRVVLGLWRLRAAGAQRAAGARTCWAGLLGVVAQAQARHRTSELEGLAGVQSCTEGLIPSIFDRIHGGHFAVSLQDEFKPRLIETLTGRIKVPADAKVGAVQRGGRDRQAGRECASAHVQELFA